MFHELQEHPGLWFVAATLTPLLSFVVLLLAGGLRWALRPARGSDDPGPLYQFLAGASMHRISAYIATGAMALAFLFSLVGAIHYAAHPAHEPEEHAHLWTEHVDWARISIFSPAPSQSPRMAIRGLEEQEAPVRASALSLGYRIDSLTIVMFLMVTFIGSLIHLFSIGYMSNELEPIVEDHQVHTEAGHLKRRGRFGRFFLFMSLFCFSMLNLVLADNLFQVFISWELVGLCSYLLISFYYERQSASNAANKAFIVNRVGDAGFILGLLIFWSYLGTFNFQEIFNQVRCPVTIGGQFAERAGEIVRAQPV